MEFLVTSRLAEEASTPAYQALTMVLKRPKARMTTVTPRIVSEVRSLWRKVFLKTSLSRCIQNTLFQMLYDTGFFCRMGIMGNHDNGLTELGIETTH